MLFAFTTKTFRKGQNKALIGKIILKIVLFGQEFLIFSSKLEVYMKIDFSKWIAVAGVCSVALLSACGDSSSSPSKSRAQKCANGLTEECLEGTWEMTGLVDLLTSPRAIRPAFDYTAAPGKLEFNSDGTLEFTFPTDAPAELSADECSVLKASWSVAAGALTIRNVTQNFDNIQMCVLENIFVKQGKHSATSITIVPELSTEGSVVKLVIPQLLMMGGNAQATDDMAFFNTTGELYSSK